MMESEDDIQPLVINERRERESSIDLTQHNLRCEPEYEKVVHGYRKSRWRTVLVYFLSTLTVGIPMLVFHWVPKWLLYLTSTRCCFEIADQVLIVETYQKKWKSFYIHKILNKNISDTSGLINEGFQDEINTEKGPIDNPGDLITPIHLDDGTTLILQNFCYFRHKKQTFIWDSIRGRWSLLAGVESGATCAQLQAMGASAPSAERRIRMLNIYGLNEIKVQVQSIMTLVLLEVFNPFYVFQLFTIAVWLAEPYYYYCGAVVLMSTFGVSNPLYRLRRTKRTCARQWKPTTRCSCGTGGCGTRGTRARGTRGCGTRGT